MMLRTEVEREKWELDQFNLEVAKFRAEHGISTPMIHLYGAMGKLCWKLIKLEDEVADIEGMKESIAGSFQHMKDKEEKYDSI